VHAHRLRLAWLRLAAVATDAAALALLWVATARARAWLGAAWAFDLVPHVDVLRDVDPIATGAKGWLIVPLFLGTLALRGRWHALRRASLDAFDTLASLAVALVASVTLVFLAGIEMSRTVLVAFAALSWPTLLLSRAASRAVLHRLRRRAFDPHRVLLVGPDHAMAPWRAVARSHPEWGLAEVARVLPDDALPHLHAGVDEVVVAGLTADELAPLAAACAEVGVPLSLDARFAATHGGAVLHDLGGLPLLTLGPAPATAARVTKRVLDVAVALIGLLLASPLLAALALWVWSHDRGSPWFVQERVGRHGRRFRLYKLRTMALHSPHTAPLAPSGKHRDKAVSDPRITGPGRWLRRLSLDELPQLLNVLRGEMSLVGPRPPLPDEVGRYAPHELRRLSVPPGMTGLWQVSGRADLPWDRWVALDLEYVDRWTLWLDLRLLLQTVPAVVRGTGAR
jgi:exopolysaccharide biosynthesis polyprenyl glycosylphosphotransferase